MSRYRDEGCRGRPIKIISSQCNVGSKTTKKPSEFKIDISHRVLLCIFL